MTYSYTNYRLSPFRITLIYLIVAGLWIAFTDQLLIYLISDNELFSHYHTLKGWFYVGITSVGLFWLIDKHAFELKASQIRLTKSEQKYRYIFEHNPQPMWIYHPETLKFIEVNEAAVFHYGYTREEFLSMTIADIRPAYEKKKVRKDVQKHRSKKTYEAEWIHQHKDGTPKNVLISASDIQLDGRTYRLVLANDITRLRLMEDKIIASVIDTEDRERKRMAGELHDGLGQYLAAANMNLESVKSYTDQLPETKQKQFMAGLNLVKHAISETRNVAHNLMPRVIEDYGLVLAVESLLDNFLNSIDIHYSFNHNMEDVVLTFSSQLNIYRVIQEAVSNAVRHANCTSISVQLYEGQDKITCTIEDNGEGAGFRDTAEEKGLGLISMKTRANALSGSIEFDSAPGKGTIIILEFPLQPNLKK